MKFADELGIPQPTYAGWEIGRTEPPIAALCKIADFLGVSLDELVGHTTVAPHAENVTAKGDINAPVAGGDINGNVGSVHNEVGSSLSDALATIKSQQEEISALRRMLEKALERR